MKQLFVSTAVGIIIITFDYSSIQGLSFSIQKIVILITSVSYFILTVPIGG